MYTLRHKPTNETTGNFFTKEDAVDGLVAGFQHNMFPEGQKIKDFEIIEAKEVEYPFTPIVAGMVRMKRLGPAMVVTESKLLDDDVRMLPLDDEDRYSDVVPVHCGYKERTEVTIWTCHRGRWEGIETSVNFDHISEISE